MAINLDYPSPTSMGVGKLTIGNGEATASDIVRFNASIAANAPPSIAQAAPSHSQDQTSPMDRRHMKIGVPKTPGLSVPNGGEFRPILMKENAHGFQS